MEVLRQRNWGKCDSEYRRHKPQECRGKAFKKMDGAKNQSEGFKKRNEEGRNLKVSDVLSTIIEEGNDTESDDSEAYGS